MTSETQTVSEVLSTGSIASPEYRSSKWQGGTYTIGSRRSFTTLVIKLRETRSATAVDEIQDELFSLGRGSAHVVDDLLRCARNGGESERVRAALLEVAAALDLAASRQALMDALSEAEPRLREVALEALADVVDEPDVRAALVRIAAEDASPVIRAKAREALT